MDPESPAPELEPDRNCPLCPRLVAYRGALRTEHPEWWNAPVRLLGDAEAWLAVIGLAPGRQGANRTGRAFTGDDSGRLLFSTLLKLGLARGPTERIRLDGAVIVNAVRCVPPGNKPTAAEIAACRRFFDPVLPHLQRLEILVALGRIAHDAVLRSAGLPLSVRRFAHGAEHPLPGGRILIDSFHCSRLNTNTGRLTPAMLEDVFRRAIAARRST
jgi:uracil-DNA glycosylase family 4